MQQKQQKQHKNQLKKNSTHFFTLIINHAVMNRFDLLNGNINSDFTQYQCDSTSKFHNEFEAKKKKREKRKTTTIEQRE